jgi:hypothetical protein
MSAEPSPKRLEADDSPFLKCDSLGAKCVNPYNFYCHDGLIVQFFTGRKLEYEI